MAGANRISNGQRRRRIEVRLLAVVSLALVVLTPWSGGAAVTALAADNGSGVAGVAGSSGSVTVERPDAWRELTLPMADARDVDLRFDVAANKASTGRGLSVNLVARRNVNAEYRLRLRLVTGGRVEAVIVRRVGDSRRILARQVLAGVAHSPGSFISLRLRVRGTAPTVISLRAWVTGQAEPTRWSLRAFDSSRHISHAGSAALRFGVSSSTTNVPVRYYYRGLDTTTSGTQPPSTPAPTPMPEATPTPSPTASPAPTPSPTASPSPMPEATPTPSPSPSIPAGAFFVAPNGSDTASGSQAAPWRTMQKAADTVPAGATVLVRAGTYGPFVMRRSGTSTAPITFAAYPGEKPVIDGRDLVGSTVRLSSVRYVNLVGLTVRGGFMERQAGGGVLVEYSSYVTVQDSVLRNNKAFGIRTYGSTHVRIVNNDIFGNAVGVRVNGAGEGIVISDNLIHDNDQMMINNADVAGDDTGATAVELVSSTGHVLVKGNYIWGNRAPSYDFGYDGGAFVIHAASNWTITENVTWDNRNVLETGTDPTRGGCDNGVFTRNLNYAATTVDRTVGMVLRCASNTLVANNTFYGHQYFVFAMSHNAGHFGRSIENLRIVNNVISVSHGRVFGYDSALPDSVVIDNNVVYVTGTAVMAQVPGRGTTTSMATYLSWTGQQAHGVQADPRFVEAGAFDFRLQIDSPAVDAGRLLAGVTDGFSGGAPDSGYSERR